MGLDMYVRKVQKPSLAVDRVYDSSELEGYGILSPEELESDLYEQLVPYTQKLPVINHYYNMEKIRADFHMPDAEINMISFDEISIGGTIDGESASRTITREQIDNLYCREQEEECLVFSVENVAYWRKDYQLQELIHDALDEYVKNMGYYLLDEATVEVINGYCATEERFDWVTPSESTALFYYEWC